MNDLNPSLKKQKTITYARSAALKGVVEESIKFQQAAIERYVKLHGLELVKSYNDIGYPGLNFGRVKLQEMLLDLETNSVDVLLMYSIDRLGRDMKANNELLSKIKEKVKNIIFIA